MKEQIRESQFAKHESYVVTNRSFIQILYGCHLKEEELKRLPEKPVVVDVGSGRNQEFARGIKRIRPDINVISIDPSFSLSTGRNDVLAWEFGDEIDYSVCDGCSDKKFFPRLKRVLVWPFQKELRLFKSTHSRRLAEAKKTKGVLVAMAPWLPFSDESVDLMIDSYGPGLYLDKELFSQYLLSIGRILKKNGQAHIYPAGVGIGPFFPSQEDKEKEIGRVGKIIEEDRGLKIKEAYFIDNSLGVVIKKDL